MIYLYVKTHTKTGIKYFGKTEQNPYLYEGSGKKWKKLLKEQGSEHQTEVVFSSNDLNEIRKFAEEYSEKNDIVNDSNFANMIEESGGYWMGNKANPNYKHGRAVNWKSNKKVQKLNDKIRNAEYHANNREKERARMKCRYYAIIGKKEDSKKWYDIWKKLSTKSISDFNIYYEKQNHGGL